MEISFLLCLKTAIFLQFKRMRETFPHKFEQQVSPSQTVASANRAAPGKARKGSVRLTPSQVAIAKKLGVPLQEYAKYVKE